MLLLLLVLLLLLPLASARGCQSARPPNMAAGDGPRGGVADGDERDPVRLERKRAGSDEEEEAVADAVGFRLKESGVLKCPCVGSSLSSSLSW